jgi:hypothetical protein
MYAMVVVSYLRVSITIARRPAAPSPIAIIVFRDIPPAGAGAYAGRDVAGVAGFHSEVSAAVMPAPHCDCDANGVPFGVHWPLMP